MLSRPTSSPQMTRMFGLPVLVAPCCPRASGAVRSEEPMMHASITVHGNQPRVAIMISLPSVKESVFDLRPYSRSQLGAAVDFSHAHLSNEKIRFQSFFMLITIQPCFVAWSYRA